jgi:integrase
METINPRKLVNSEKNEQWARLFLQRLEGISNSNVNFTEGDVKLLEIVLGDLKRCPKKYFVSRDNLQYILGYSKHLLINSFGKPITAGRVANLLIYLADFVGEKNFKGIRRDDIEHFLERYNYNSESYKATLKRVIKPFFRWLHGYTVKQGYPEVVDWIYCGRKKNGRLPEILTMEEIKKMIDVCDNMRDRALVSMLYESGCRASELLDLKINSLNFDEYGAVLVVSGKTGSRRVRLISCIADLKAWLNVHPGRNEPNVPLFCALTKNNKGSPLGDSSLDFIISQIAKKANVGKRVYPHLFRHTRATHLARHLKETELRIVFGWSKDSKTPSTYIHLSGSDVEDRLLELNGIKIKENEKPPVVPTTKCYRCSEVNSIANKFCYKCNAPLQQETINRLEIIKGVISEVTAFVFQKMEEKKVGNEDLEGIVKEWYESKKINESK